MTILFPNDVLRPREVERDFASQAKAAAEAGLQVLLLDYEALNAGETARALRFVRAVAMDDPQVLLLRGWMLRPQIYAALHEALGERNWMLVNSPAAYELCHLLPNWCPLFEGRTPRSRWLPIPECFDAARVVETAAQFGSSALMVKDYVKSRKHEWDAACFIPAADDEAAVTRVTRTFLERQAESLVGGLVLREFVPLRQVASAEPGQAPVFNEWRLFRWCHRFIAGAPHAARTSASFEAPPLEVVEAFDGPFYGLKEYVQSHFYTMDVAQTEAGDWIVIELGDGGVSGLPSAMDERKFYTALAGKLR
jgi:hypothetical protein